MGISNFYTKTFTVYRQEYVGNKSEYQELGEINCHLQQISPDEQVQLGMAYTKPFRIWCAPNTDIQEGDQLMDNDGVYTVKGVQKNNFVGQNKHLDILIDTAFLSESV